MRQGGNILYRCRKCGEEFTNTHTPDCLASLTYACLGVDMNPKVTGPTAPMMFDIHLCSGARGPAKGTVMGIGDLIGAIEDDRDQHTG